MDLLSHMFRLHLHSGKIPIARTDVSSYAHQTHVMIKYKYQRTIDVDLLTHMFGLHILKTA